MVGFYHYFFQQLRAQRLTDSALDAFAAIQPFLPLDSLICRWSLISCSTTKGAPSCNINSVVSSALGPE